MAERKIVKITGDVPGPKGRQLYSEMEQNVPRGPAHMTPIAIASSKGATITDVDGNTYIDFASGIGTLNLGHCPDEIVKAIKEQADKYLHTCFHVTLYEPYIRLANKLNTMTPGQFPKKTLFLCSGAEAVENAIKIAKYYTNRYGILSFLEGFHGRTAAAMSLTGQIQPYKYNFGPPIPWIYHLPFPYCYRCPFSQTYPGCELACLKYVERVFESIIPPDAVAAVIVEPVQGEGGFIVPPKEFLPGLYEICKAKGIVFIDDEIQTGMARTGKLFATEHFGIEPDLLTTAKSVGGGMVLSAVTGKAEIMDAPHPGGLGGTFGGHPLSCQAGLVAFELIEKNNLIDRANAIGNKVKQAFSTMQEKYPIIGDVRGLGAMVAIELVKDRKTKEPAKQEAALIREKCYKNGLIAIGAGIHHNVIRTLIPLVITDEELEEGLSILDEALSSITTH
ncbi:MAG: 4-aminobutyrate--2-oxoglutarate transaminase [Chloroflexi bacterium]|nr:MAG: 4-aminobutyrate--2-oxoglutarate transaminase [Chloroflexota bacterium]